MDVVRAASLQSSWPQAGTAAVSSRKQMRSGWLAWIAFFLGVPPSFSPILRYTQNAWSIPAIALVFTAA
jgi:hypothetical protein